MRCIGIVGQHTEVGRVDNYPHRVLESTMPSRMNWAPNENTARVSNHPSALTPRFFITRSMELTCSITAERRLVLLNLDLWPHGARVVVRYDQALFPCHMGWRDLLPGAPARTAMRHASTFQVPIVPVRSVGDYSSGSIPS